MCVCVCVIHCVRLSPRPREVLWKADVEYLRADLYFWNDHDRQWAKGMFASYTQSRNAPSESAREEFSEWNVLFTSPVPSSCWNLKFGENILLELFSNKKTRLEWPKPRDQTVRHEKVKSASPSYNRFVRDAHMKQASRPFSTFIFTSSHPRTWCLMVKCFRKIRYFPLSCHSHSPPPPGILIHLNLREYSANSYDLRVDVNSNNGR